MNKQPNVKVNGPVIGKDLEVFRVKHRLTVTQAVLAFGLASANHWYEIVKQQGDAIPREKVALLTRFYQKNPEQLQMAKVCPPSVQSFLNTFMDATRTQVAEALRTDTSALHRWINQGKPAHPVTARLMEALMILRTRLKEASTERFLEKWSVTVKRELKLRKVFTQPTPSLACV